MLRSQYRYMYMYEVLLVLWLRNLSSGDEVKFKYLIIKKTDVIT